MKVSLEKNPIERYQRATWYLNGPSRPSLCTRNNIENGNIFLIGPPGCGKTTVGRELARLMNKPHLDIDDDWLEPRWKTSVASKLTELGDDQFLEAEAREIFSINHKNHVISLTGSNPLHNQSIEYLSRIGIFIYLDVPRETILNRCQVMKIDRIIGQKTKSLNEILNWREHIYEKCYDIRIIVSENETQMDIAKKVLKELENKTKLYQSTRSTYDNIQQEFLNVVKQGLAADGGLFISCSFNPLSLSELKRLIDLPYPELALRIIERFPLGYFHPSHLRSLLWQSYSVFGENVLPIRHLRKNQYLMETFHGPTASFKDLSLQLLPHLMQAAIELTAKTDKKLKSLGLVVATSGDTGCAALDAFVRLPDTPVIVLYPHTGVSSVQKAQMQTVSGNACVLGVNADFDFCQNMVKELFNDEQFLSDVNRILPNLQLTSANSINWARFLPQVVFTISSYLQLVQQNIIQLGQMIDVCIPTGNFGNILGAVFARRLGLPIRKLIAASNDNNVITDFIQTGSYDLRHRIFKKTISPSIDILISSNLERFLFLLTNGNSSLIKQLFNQLEHDRYFNVDNNLLKQIQSEIQGDWATENECLEEIKDIFYETKQLIDPHTAVAVHVANKLSKSDDIPMIISSTAHYGKFPETIIKSIASNHKESSSNDIGILFKELESYESISSMHSELLKLPMKSVQHTNFVEATKTSIINEITIFLEDFSKK